MTSKLKISIGTAWHIDGGHSLDLDIDVKADEYGAGLWTTATVANRFASHNDPHLETARRDAVERLAKFFAAVAAGKVSIPE